MLANALAINSNLLFDSLSPMTNLNTAQDNSHFYNFSTQTPLNYAGQSNFSDKLLAFAGAGNFVGQSLAISNNTSNFLANNIIGHQSNVLTDAIANTQYAIADQLPNMSASMVDLGKYQTNAYQNMMQNIQANMTARTNSTNNVASNANNNSSLLSAAGMLLMLL